MFGKKWCGSGVLLVGVIVFAGESAVGQTFEEFTKDQIAREEAVKPLPLAAIPDDPPPHEGALSDLTYTIDAPDLLLVEVLEALPGRPVSGERLVRPDGMINLGFYGDVHVRGLTLSQAKVKIIERLRKFLPNEVLGLSQIDPGDWGEPGKEKMEGLPALPAEKPALPPIEKKEGEPKNKPASVRMFKRAIGNEENGEARLKTSSIPMRKIVQEKEQTTKVEIPVGGNIKIVIEIQSTEKPSAVVAAPVEPEGEMGRVIPVKPADSNRVFVDVSGYNSKFYFVHGEVHAPGRLPCMGNETIFDAINFAGGFISTADSKNIKLVRPARGGKPTKVYHVDLEAIMEKGDKTANYQLFPGDRLIVGRRTVVEAEIESDRMGTTLGSMVNGFRRAKILEESINDTFVGRTVEERQALKKDVVRLWWKAMTTTGGAELLQSELRELLEKSLKLKESEEKK